MWDEIFFAVIVVCTAGVLLYALYGWLNKKFTATVSETSERYRDLLEINTRYTFEDVKAIYKYNYTYKTKAKFEKETLKFDELFEKKIEDDIAKYEKIEERVKRNKELLEKYIIDINGCHPAVTKETNKTHVPFFVYKRIEKKLFEQARIRPVTEPKFVLYGSYVSPKGRNQYEYDEEYSFEDMQHHMNVAVINKAYKETESYRRQQERMKINDSLRYDVLKKDNFRCRLCGAAQSDGVKLVVDHIRPVAKGGSSDMSNLRTLCNRCNSGKSDKYDENGLN